jgi:hypothetical protein
MDRIGLSKKAGKHGPTASLAGKIHVEYAAIPDRKGGALYRQHVTYALIDRGVYAASITAPYTRLFGPGGITAVKSGILIEQEAVPKTEALEQPWVSKFNVYLTDFSCNFNKNIWKIW